MIGDKTLKIFLDGMKFNHHLRFLNLSQNGITSEGAKYIKHFLIRNQTLRVLFLHWNALGSKGSKRIAKAIGINTQL